MTQFYVYKLINSLDNQPFYVGKGKGPRMYQHLREATRDSYKNKRSVHSKIINILNNGGKVLYEKIEVASEQEAFDEEKRLIALYGRKDLGLGPLHNLTDGGEGSVNANPESIENRRAKHIGSKRSEEAKENMRQAQLKIVQENLEKYGSKRSAESRQKQSNTTKGREWSTAKRSSLTLNPNAKTVLVYKKDTGEFVGEYESISKCARDLKCDCTTIWKICRDEISTPAPNGKSYICKSHKGYTFKYKEG